MNGSESWEAWHDDWYDRDEGKFDYAEEYEDDIEEHKRLRDEEE